MSGGCCGPSLVVIKLSIPLKEPPVRQFLPKLLLVALAAAALIAVPAASAAGPTPKVTVTSPTAGAYLTAAPALAFTTVGTQLEKTCSLTGPGIDFYDEGCSSPYKPAANLTDGTYTYSISISNEDGSDAVSRTFTIDTTPLTLGFTSAPPEGMLGNAQVLSYKAAYSDANLQSLTCKFADAEADPGCGNSGVVQVSYNSFPDGPISFSIVATDRAGNVSTITRNVTIDRVKPTAGIALVGGGGESRDNTPAFTVSGSDASGISYRHCRIEGQTEWEDCEGSSWVTPEAIEDGFVTAALEVADKAGNSNYASYSFTLDATIPVVTYEGFPGDRTTNTRPSIVFHVEDAHETTSECGFDAAGWDELAGCAPEEGQLPAGELAFGQHQFWIATTDSFGNVASTVYTFEVADPSLPTGPTGGGQDGENPGGEKTPTLKMTSKVTKVRRGYFFLTVRSTATNVSPCSRVRISFLSRSRPARAFNLNVGEHASGFGCITSKKIKLPKRLKRKKATIVVHRGSLKVKKTIRL